MSRISKNKQRNRRNNRITHFDVIERETKQEIIREKVNQDEDEEDEPSLCRQEGYEKKKLVGDEQWKQLWKNKAEWGFASKYKNVFVEQKQQDNNKMEKNEKELNLL